jgi:glutathione-specific gamma-glutamylcyclotransferase
LGNKESSICGGNLRFRTLWLSNDQKGLQMWVFGYGSLMWDDWEKQFDGQKYDKALLKDFQRDFNKKSIRNWGTRELPGPTLGLESLRGSECIGSAFEFADDKEESVIAYLEEREGPSFGLSKLEILLSDNQSVQAFVPINQRMAQTYIGNISLDQRAEMAKKANGTHGNCIDYIANIRNKLLELEIKDVNVENFWQAIQSIDSTGP